MKNKKIILRTGILLGVLITLGILLSSYVFAFAISRPHMEEDENGNPQIFLLPGETTGITFVVQNGGGATSPITIQVSVIEGSEVIQITDPEDVYDIEAGGRVDVITQVSIPENAQIGDSYSIRLAFTTVSQGTGGFTFGSSIEQAFNVVVGEEIAEEVPVEEVPQVVPEEEVPIPISKTNLGIIIAIVILIILILIIYLIIRNRKRKISQETVGIEKSSRH